jgi:hypothetical protein
VLTNPMLLMALCACTRVARVSRVAMSSSGRSYCYASKRYALRPPPSTQEDGLKDDCYDDDEEQEGERMQC